MKMRKWCQVMVLLAAALCLMLLSGCGKSALSEKELMEVLPDDLVNYYVDGEYYYTEPTELTIDARNTDGETDHVECTVTMEDDLIQRIEGVALDLVYYEEGGWQVTGWTRTTDGMAFYKSAPPEHYFEDAVAPFGYQSLEVDNEEMMDETYYERTYKVDESYDYVSFSGTLKVAVTLEACGYAGNGDITYIYWSTEADNSGVEMKWGDVLGTWTGTSKKKLSRQTGDHGEFELTLTELKENGWCEGSGSFRWPGGPDDKITMQEEKFVEASYEQKGDCPANAEFNIRARYGEYGHGGNITITAERVKVNFEGYWYDFKHES